MFYWANQLFLCYHLLLITISNISKRRCYSSPACCRFKPHTCPMSLNLPLMMFSCRFLPADATPRVLASKWPDQRLHPSSSWLQASSEPPSPSPHLPPEPGARGHPASTHASPQRPRSAASSAFWAPGVGGPSPGPLASEGASEGVSRAVQSGATDGGGPGRSAHLPGPLH